MSDMGYSRISMSSPWVGLMFSSGYTAGARLTVEDVTCGFMDDGLDGSVYVPVAGFAPMLGGCLGLSLGTGFVLSCLAVDA